METASAPPRNHPPMLNDPFGLNLRHLQAMLAVRQHGSVSGAALRVGLSQPALTQAVMKLEQLFGCAIFERRADGMLITSVGEQIAQRVDAALAHLASGAQPLARGKLRPERRMTMTQLKAFLALADSGSFVAAAQAAGMSRTAAHRAVGDLEDAVGEPLVERHGRGVNLKASGRRLARGARLAVAELAALFVELGLQTAGTLIGIGVTPAARAFVAPEAMARMTGAGSPAAFRVFEGSWAELVEPLRDGVIDLIVGEVRDYEISDLAQQALYEDQLIVVSGSQHLLAGVANVSSGKLRAYPWIVGLPNSPLRSAWETLFEGHELPPCPIECGSVMVIGRLLTNSNLLTLLHPDQAALQIRSGLLAQVGKPLPHTTSMIGITVRRSWRPTVVQQRFMQLLQQVSRDAGRSGSREGQLVAAWV